MVRMSLIPELRTQSDDHALSYRIMAIYTSQVGDIGRIRLLAHQPHPLPSLSLQRQERRAKMRFLSLIPVACALLGLCGVTGVNGRRMTKTEMRARQHDAAKRWAPEIKARANARRDDPGAGVKNITFSNPKASGEIRYLTWSSKPPAVVL
jgi:hypothetical protein